MRSVANFEVLIISIQYLFLAIRIYFNSKFYFTILEKHFEISQMEYKRLVVVCTTAEIAEFVSNEMLTKYKLENILNQSKIYKEWIVNEAISISLGYFFSSRKWNGKNSHLLWRSIGQNKCTSGWSYHSLRFARRFGNIFISILRVHTVPLHATGKFSNSLVYHSFMVHCWSFT